MKKTLVITSMALLLCIALLGSNIFANEDNQPEVVSEERTLTQAPGDGGQAGAGVSTDPGVGRMVISEPGSYTLTGNMKGTVLVDPGAGDVELILDNVTIDGGASAAIAAVSGDSLTIKTIAGSVNRITDSAMNQEYDAAVYSSIDVIFGGEGTLEITGGNRNGLHLEGADLTVENGVYRIHAASDGIVAGGSSEKVILNGGTLWISAGGSSIAPYITVEQNGGELIEEALSGNISLNTPDAAITDATSSDAAMQISEEPAADLQQPAEITENSQNPETTEGESAGQQAPQFPEGDSNGGQMPQFPEGESAGEQAPQFAEGASAGASAGQQAPQFGSGQQPANMQGTTLSSAESAGEIVEGITENSASSLEEDYGNATTYTITDEDSQVNISESGTYVVTGSSSNGNITVKKGTTGVVLVLEDLDLTSVTGATLSINKEAEVKVVVSGTVTLTDGENPADEESTDAEVADAFDGAAIKIKANSVVCITGDGTLNINGDAKNGIKGGDESSLVIDGDVTVNIKAANDGINSNYDVAVLNGTVTVDAADDAIHADHILTIGNEDGTGPQLNVTNSTEGLEATVINVRGGNTDITSSDDGINAANGDGIYEGELTYSYNQTGGSVTVNAVGDGIDSNGNVNLIGGSAQLQSGLAGGEAGIDYDGSLYLSDDFSLNNASGVSGADMMPGQGFPGGGMTGQMPGQSGASSGAQAGQEAAQSSTAGQQGSYGFPGGFPQR